MAEYNDTNTDRKTGKPFKQYNKDRPDTVIDRGNYAHTAPLGDSGKTLINNSDHIGAGVSWNISENKQLAELNQPDKKQTK